MSLQREAMAENTQTRAGMPVAWSFLREKGVAEVSIKKMMERCNGLGREGVERKLQPNWAFLEQHIGIPKRKLPSIVSRCPQILVLGLHEKLRPMADCLGGLGAKKVDLAAAILRFPNLFIYSVEEKLCPLLGFLQGAGVPESRLAKVFLSCPRLLSYSIDAKLEPTVNFLLKLGVKRGDEMGKLLTRWPHIFGYSIERRLQPTVSYLERMGLKKEDICRLAVRFPHILCRDAEKTYQPNVNFLQDLGFSTRQISSVISGYPPVLLASVKNSLQPKMDFLLKGMGRSMDDAVAYPAFFAHSLSRKIEPRFRKLQRDGIQCSLEGMLSCNQKKFSEGNLKFGQNPMGKLAHLSL